MRENIAKFIEDDFEIDGDVTKEVWNQAEWSPRFVDVIGNTPAILDTKAADLWSDQYVYFGFYCESPHPKGSMTNDGDLLWFDNDVEIFIDGKDTYYELQVNALNTIYEAFYIWRDAYKEKNIYREQVEFDVIENDARVFGGNHDRTGLNFWNGSHPRGNRWAFLNWEMKGLETAVKVDGKLNDDSVLSNSVMYEIKIPWNSLKWLGLDKNLPAEDGDVWNIFLGRYENLRVNGTEVAVGWSWDYIGSDDNHRPELFTPITFKK